jgi:hypothetical protein
MRLDLDHVDPPALRLSIAAAMVIAIPDLKEVINFSPQPTFAKKCQQRVMTMQLRDIRLTNSQPVGSESQIPPIAALFETRAERRDVVIRQ